MKQRFENLGSILNRDAQKKLIGGNDGGQCWSTCEAEFHSNCLNIYINQNGHGNSEYETNCLGAGTAEAYCMKKCSTPVQPVNQ